MEQPNTMIPSSNAGKCSRRLLGKDARKAYLKPMKTIIAEEMSKGTYCRRASPSIIAKLMGLDAFPTNEGKSKQKETRKKTWYGKTPVEEQQRVSESLLDAYEQFSGKGISNRSHSSQSPIMDHREFKDVFEVEETSEIFQPCYSVSGNWSGRIKIPESSDVFVRHNYVGMKHPSIDDKLWHSEKFHDVMSHVDSKRYLFQRTIPEPDLPFTKHLHNLRSVPSHFSSAHIAVLSIVVES